MAFTMNTSFNFTNENSTHGYNVSYNVRGPLMAGLIIFSIQASFSLIANLLVVVLFIHRTNMLRNPHYCCILSLAITDILTSISVLTSPISYGFGEKFYSAKEYGYVAREVYCRLLWSSSLPFTLGVASLYISTVLSFERWLAVRRCIFYKSRFKQRHMNALIIASYVLAFVSEVPFLIYIEGIYDHPTEICQYTFFVIENSVHLCLLCGKFLFQTVLPLAYITFAYIDVFRGIRASLRFATSAGAESVNSVKRLKKVTNVAAITTFLLVVCWLPCAVWYFALLTADDPVVDAFDQSFIFVTLLVFCNCCINPCVYVFSNPELRNALRGLFRQYQPNAR